jgi:hypothetical protein
MSASSGQTNYKTLELTPLSPKKNNSTNANYIFKKLKNRLPMFIINIYCTTATLMYGDNMLKGIDHPVLMVGDILLKGINLDNYCTTAALMCDDDFVNNTSNNNGEYTNTLLFKIYYIILCLCAILWDIWHSSTSYNGERSLCNKIAFCSTSVMISFPLFVVATNVASFGLPLYIFFGFTKNEATMFYGLVLIITWFMNVVETHYWKTSVDNYIQMEDADDVNSANDENSKDDDTQFKIFNKKRSQI